MKKLLFKLNFLLLLCLLLFACNSNQHRKIENKVSVKETSPNNKIDSTIYWLYVARSESGYVDGDWIVFNNPDRKLLYFSDRPNRIAGHLALEELNHIWGGSGDSFERDPPNAVLALEDDEIEHKKGHVEPEETVITLHEVKVTNSTLRFRYSIIMGKIPKTFKQNSLFIDRRPPSQDPCSTCPSSFGC